MYVNNICTNLFTWKKNILHFIILICIIFFALHKVSWDNRNLSHSTISNGSHKLSDFDESYIIVGMLAEICWAFASVMELLTKSFRW